MGKTIVHVSEVSISPDSGMGRVEYYWEQAIRKAGFDFVHIGPKEIGAIKHKVFLQFKAYQYFKKINKDVVALIVHEPFAMFFVNQSIPVFIESHGVERRNWEGMLKEDNANIGFKTKLLYPIWRLSSCDAGLKKAGKLLLINNDDKEYVIKHYHRTESDICVFKNGAKQVKAVGVPTNFTVLFNGSWIERKGIKTLIEAANLLQQKSLKIKYLIIGTGKTSNEVLNDWANNLIDDVEVIPKFDASQELELLAKASVVVLPSNFEGQPLSILQAMAAGKCCITTNSCGQKDFIENGKNGLLFEKHDAVDFAELIEKCYHNPKMVKDIGVEAIESMKNRSWEQCSDELVEYIKSNI
jgi:glycosyltransferase involved in cell wall biosynthesis